MVDSDGVLQHQKELKSLFDAAEGFIKKAEHYQVGLSIPAINELRYAGQHLLRALVGVDPDDRIEPDDIADSDDMISAKKHCLRAQYDAAEGPILFFMKQIRDFQKDYKN